MFTNHWQRQVVFFPSSILCSRIFLFSSVFTPHPVVFLPRNQSNKGIRFTGVATRWIAWTYPIRIYRDARTHARILHIVGHCMCVYTLPRYFCLKRLWDCCLGNGHILFRLCYSFFLDESMYIHTNLFWSYTLNAI